MEFTFTLGTGGNTKEEERVEEEERARGEKRVVDAACQPLAPSATEGEEVRAEEDVPLALRISPPEPGPSTTINHGVDLEQEKAPGVKIKPGPRCAKEKARERARRAEERRKKEEGRRKMEREEARDEKRGIFPRDSSCDATRGTSPDGTSQDVSADEELGSVESEPPSTRLMVVASAPNSVSSASGATSGTKRGRGRPATMGEFVGLAKAKMELVEAERKELEWSAEKEILQSGLARRVSERSAKRSRSEGGVEGDKSLRSEVPREVSRRSLRELREGLSEAADAVLKVARTSNHLKGTYVKELKTVAGEVREGSEELGRRLQAKGDVLGLEAENARLRLEVEDLKAELRSLRAIIEALQQRGDPPATSVFRFTGNTVAGEGRMEVETSAPPQASSPVQPALGKRKRRVVVSLSSESDKAPPPNKKAGGRTPPPPLTKGPEPVQAPIGAEDLLTKISALMDRRFADLRAELGIRGPAGPTVTRVEVLAPPGSKRIVDVKKLREKQASAVLQGAKTPLRPALASARAEEPRATTSAAPSAKSKGGKTKSSSQTAQTAQPRAGPSGHVLLALTPLLEGE